MRMREPKPDEWPKLDFNDEYAAGSAYSRFVWLAEYDPFVALFGIDTITRLANMFFSEEVLGMSSIKHQTDDDVVEAVSTALYDSPMGLMLSNTFVSRLADLVGLAIFGSEWEV